MQQIEQETLSYKNFLPSSAESEKKKKKLEVACN